MDIPKYNVLTREKWNVQSHESNRLWVPHNLCNGMEFQNMQAKIKALIYLYIYIIWALSA